jgi:hypothetical protein
MSPPQRTMNGAPRQSEGREAQESWWSGDGSPDSFAPRDPEAQAGLDVKPPKGERGGAATKASTRSNGSKLWRVEPQEGIDGRNLRVPVSERTRRGNKALKQAGSLSLSSGEVGRAGKRQEGMGSERSTDRGEGKPLKGEAHGCSGTLVVPGGPVVEIAKGVTKPRTRYAVAEGFAAGKRIRRFETVS